MIDARGIGRWCGRAGTTAGRRRGASNTFSFVSSRSSRCRCGVSGAVTTRHGRQLPPTRSAVRGRGGRQLCGGGAWRPPLSARSTTRSSAGPRHALRRRRSLHLPVAPGHHGRRHPFELSHPFRRRRRPPAARARARARATARPAPPIAHARQPSGRTRCRDHAANASASHHRHHHRGGGRHEHEACRLA